MLPRCTQILAAVAAALVSLSVTSTAWAWQAIPKPEAAAKANRLAKETSPYLLLHAHNPVDWYPWGPDAFAKAKAENKPIFLSVGYSSCYWCHVMERECFANAAIAKQLNDKFVCVKVDREERPDVDQVYMAALQVFGRGGWPMSMFLTPDGRPFFGGTYFPPADKEGMEGFPSILTRVSDAWRDQRPALDRDATRLSALVKQTLDGAAAGRRVPLSRKFAQDGLKDLTAQFDTEYGGFGFNPENARRPKFPEPVNLVFLLDRHRRDSEMKAEAKAGTTPPSPLEMVRVTLDHMARGGIRDQLAGGYHRYATSRYWIVPHFEKMLYDNAQLASAHLAAFEATGDARWRAEAEATFAFVARTMTAPEGGFYSALDAETGGEEGRYYVWGREEVQTALAKEPGVEAFLQVYGLKRDPNFEKDRYVLLEPRSRQEQAKSLGLSVEELEAKLAPLRGKLLAIRDARPGPLKDDKVVTSWNALMITAYADGYRILEDERYRKAAEKAADFLLAKLRTPDGRLLRTYRDGRAKLPAYLEDYAFLAHALLRLHASTGDQRRLEQAKALTDRMIEDFADAKAGGFFYTAGDHETLLARPKDPVDGVLPGPNSVAIRNLVALAALTGEKRYLDFAGQGLEAFSARLSQAPSTVPLMLVSLEEYLDARPEAIARNGPPTRDEPNDDPLGLGRGTVVTATGAISNDDQIEPGKEFEVVISVTIKEGWHAYANRTGVEGVPGTRVELVPGQGVSLVKVEYPSGVGKVLGSTGAEKVNLYEGKVEIKVLVKADPGAKRLPETLSFYIHYQACDDRTCQAPTRLKVAARLKAQ